MPVQVICKFHKDLINNESWKDALNNVNYGLFQQSRAINSKVTGLTWLEFELV